MPMKLLVFAHTPPPHHGQSYMVQLMLEGLGGDVRQRPAGAAAGPVECYHVNARFSRNLEDVGTFRWGKSLLAVGYCLQAIWCRLRYGVRMFYYVPAPGRRAALYRDWLIMALCRPFFPQFVHHWHAVGLGDWLQREATWLERWVTHRLLGRPVLGLALAVPAMRDALWFRAREVQVVPNGIPDPCPDYRETVRRSRAARAGARRKAAQERAGRCCRLAGDEATTLRVLYLAHCTAEKGLFDTLAGFAALLPDLPPGVQAHLTVAGVFQVPAEEERFHALVGAPPLAGRVTYAGFVRGAEKDRLLRGSDVFCFPTYYPAEGQPVNLIEALAYGLPVVTTRWRAIPELLPPGYAGYVLPHDAAGMAARLRLAASGEWRPGAELRARFEEMFVLPQYVGALTRALAEVAE